MNYKPDLSQQDREVLHNLSQSKSWQRTSEILQEYLDFVVDLRNMSDEEKKDYETSVKARLRSYEALTQFLLDIGLLGENRKGSRERYD